VLEVDAQGRPAWVRRLDCVTGEISEVEFVKGYRPANVVVHQYDPLAALKGDGE
jgi:hypothetical protein